jgi:hypothetical protein
MPKGWPGFPRRSAPPGRLAEASATYFDEFILRCNVRTTGDEDRRRGVGRLVVTEFLTLDDVMEAVTTPFQWQPGWTYALHPAVTIAAPAPAPDTPS